MALTAQQLKERLGYLGGSDAAAALGLSNWKTQLSLWAEKTEQIEPEDISNKFQIRYGNKFEDAVAEFFMEETGKKVHRVNETLYHPVHKFLAVNVDRRVVGEDALLECKTSGSYASKNWAGGNIPQDYILQCLHSLAVTGKKKCYIACLIGNQEIQIKEIIIGKGVDDDTHLYFDQKFVNDITKKEVDFWMNYVVPKRMPTTVTEDDGSTLYKLFPISDPNADVILEDDSNILVEQIKAMQTEMALLDKDIETRKNTLKLNLGKAEQGRTQKWRITWKLQKGSTYQVVKQDTRVLRISEFKEDKPKAKKEK